MKFKITHHISEKSVEYFTEESPPEWLVSKEYKWFYDEHVMKLEINESIYTVFRNIKRIE